MAAILQMIFKLPRSGVCLSFQFISAASVSATAMTFASHVKSI